MTSAECGLADMTLQTPMLESDAPNELGPPPPDPMPTRKLGISCDDSAPDTIMASVAVALHAVCGYRICRQDNVSCMVAVASEMYS